MPPAPGLTGSAAVPPAGTYIAVVDVGSNSVRLVVFTGPDRSPTPIFNEKVLAGLGRNLAETGKLDAQGVEAAVAAVRRFVALAERMKVSTFDLVATAAAREASDGAAFIERIKRECGVAPRILSGAEEARLSALGVVSGFPDADGIMGDLGGGSLELVALNKATLGDHATLPLGPFRLAHLSPSAARDRADEALASLPWLDEGRGRSLYLVGGAWRAIARVHMAQTNYPLHIIHHYQVPAEEMADMARLLSRQSRDSVARMVGVPKRRLETIPLAALVLRRLIKRAKPAQIVFSANGVREGLHFDILPPAVRAEDPFLALCRDMGGRENRFGMHGDDLDRFIQPVFPDAKAEETRLRLAACLLADVAWRVNPDYRGEQAFRRILRAPFVGIDHPSRAFVALAVHARYEGHIDAPTVESSLQLVSAAGRQRALAIGLAIRLGEALTGGTNTLDEVAELSIDGKELNLAIRPAGRPLLGEAVERRFEALADCLNLRSAIVETGRRTRARA
jgi:exopolyphosphatase/guanosine-5'-triphosphate,3'-diphosphate pyrophosphatase